MVTRHTHILHTKRESTAKRELPLGGVIWSKTNGERGVCYIRKLADLIYYFIEKTSATY